MDNLNARKRGGYQMSDLSVVFIANTGRKDQPLPDYLKEALARFQKESTARYCIVAHDLVVGTGDGIRVSSVDLRLSGRGRSIQYALLNMLGNFDPGAY